MQFWAKSTYANSSWNPLSMTTSPEHMNKVRSKPHLSYNQIVTQIADAIPVLVWTTDGNGMAEYFNERYFEYTGKTFEELRGNGWRSILHPDDLDRCVACWKESVAEGKHYEIEYRLYCKSDNSFRWHLGRGFPVRSDDGQIVHWFGTCTDIEQQKQLQIMLQSVMDNISQSIFWKDKHSVFLGCNKLFAQNAGFGSPNELIGKTDYDFPNVPKEQADFFRACDKYVMEKDTPEYNIIEPFCAADGKTIWLSTSKIPLHDANGAVTGILCMFTDVTDRENLLAQRDDFMASLAHDLKVPIVGAMKVLEAVLRGTTGPINPQQNELITMLQTSNTNLLQMVNNLLQVLKYEAETDELYFTNFEFVDLIHECVKEITPIAEAKKVNIIVRMPDVASIHGDRLALRRVVFNLLSNAIDYSASGSSVKLILAEGDSESYVLTVTNLGEPISEEDLGNLFQRFWQGQRFGVGTGLGLYHARQVVEGHGGEISCSSDRTNGTTIKAIVPKKGVATDIKDSLIKHRSKLSIKHL